MVATTTCSSGRDGNLLLRRTSYASFPKDALHNKTKSKTIPHKKAQKTKTVRFAAAAKVTNRHQVMTMEDLPNAWYQPKDYAHIKKDILGSIQAITNVFSNSNSACTLDLSQHCLRGIETAISAELYQRRKLRIKSTLHSVLEQQDAQRAMGVSDPLALRAISIQCSQDAQDSAVSVGQLDSKL